MGEEAWLSLSPVQTIPAVGAIVAILAIGVQLWSSSELTAGDVGDSCFKALTTDAITFILPAAYFRFAVHASAKESARSRAVAALIVAVAAYMDLQLVPGQFSMLLGTLAASYVFMCGWIPGTGAAAFGACVAAGVVALVLKYGLIIEAARLGLGLGIAAIASNVYGQKANGQLPRHGPGSKVLVGGIGFVIGMVLVPPIALKVAVFLLPIGEISEAYEMIANFVGHTELRSLCTNLFLVTVLCQVSLGYLGIAFIRRGQERKNALVYVGDGKQTARGFTKLVGMYMLTVAMPYMLQRTVMENVNSYVYGVFARRVERSLRLGAVFPKGPDGGVSETLLAAVHGSKYTVEAYTDAYNSIVGVCYNVIEHKLFAFPKLMLLPGMLMKRPWLVVTVLPASVALDVGRANLIASLTKRLERMSREIQELAQRRRKVEQHDTKHEELIRRGAASDFAEAQWEEIAVEIEDRTLRFHALSSLRGFINALYKQDFLLPGIELVLAWLLESKHIPSTDIWVYTRVVEDAIDMLLTRFRMDATLASMRTNIDRVADLSGRLQSVRDRGYADCTVEPEAGQLRIRGLEFARGSSQEIKIADLTLYAGRIYVVTGANGSGKSTLFGLLASCGQRATVLPDGLVIRALDQLAVPSGDIVEVGQQLYCPLFTKPLAWMLQQRHLDSFSSEQLAAYEARIAELSAQLAFHGATDSSAQATGLSHEELHEEQQDWYGTLSGGQRVKAELIRKVFLRDRCPGILLIDEAFAPLDPPSKMIVQRLMKEFCADSLLLVIYHQDADESCLTGKGSFFDENLHFGNGTAVLTKRC